MKKKNKAMHVGILGLALSTLLLLPGCRIVELFKDKLGSEPSAAPVSVPSSTSSSHSDDSKALLSIDGKSVITEASFDKYYEQFVSSNPQLQSMIQFMPNAKKEIFNGMANERILLVWGEKNNIHGDAEYKKELEQSVRMIKTNLAAKRFEKDLIGTIAVTDKEMRDYYESHKDPELIVSPGGIKAEGKEFDTKEKAQVLFDKVKDDAKGFKAAAGDKVKDFAPINKMSFDVDNALKDKVMELTSFPKVIMVEAANKKYWVVAALKKEETQHRSFDEVKEGLKKMIEREKTMKIYTEKIGQLKKEYNVTENTSYFEKEVPNAGLPHHMMPHNHDHGHDDEEHAKKKDSGIKAL
ncbi:MAG: hypothetical protein ACJAZS_000292 [Alteromonas naphthalenivorans]|jgi:hypothetical protein